MATGNQKEIEIIEGEVTNAYPPSKNDEGVWRPANIYIETEEGTVSISQFPKGDYEPIQMPEWYKSLDLDNLVGLKIQAAAAYKSTYKETRQYVNVQTFKVVSDLPKPAPKQQEAHRVAKPSSVDENQMRIMRQSTLHYASILVAPMVKDFDHPQTMVERTIWLAGKLLEYVISGEMPFEADNHEEPEDELFPDNGVQSI